MKINNMFYSLQGESTYAGLPCIFIRLAGCNLTEHGGCLYCDTDYAQKMSQGKEMTVDEVVKEITKLIKNTNCRLIEITGGEPLQQKDEVVEFCKQLFISSQSQIHILIETNGTIRLQGLNLPRDYVTIIMDIKTPSSGVSDRNILGNINNLTDWDEIKFVVGTTEDLKYMTKILNQYKPTMHILVSPVWGGELGWGEIAEYIKNNHPNVRMQLQMHKLIWDPERRGV